MNYFSDPVETASRFGDYIEDLHDVFRCNGVDFGCPEDFFAFARTMNHHSELRGDVMRVVKSIMDSETNVSFRTILTILEVASGGIGGATSGREMRVPVKLIIESLSGIDASDRLSDDQADTSGPDPIVNDTAQGAALDRPLPGNVAPLVPAANPAHPREEAGARYSATIPSAPEPQLMGNDPQMWNQQSTATTGPLARPGPVRTSIQRSYSSWRQFAGPTFVGVAMLLLAASLFWRSGRDTNYVVRPVNASAEGEPNGAGASVMPRATSPVSGSPVNIVSESRAATAGDPSVALAGGTQGNSSALTLSPTGQGVSRPAAKLSKKSAQVSVRSSSGPPSVLAMDVETAPVVATERSETTASSDRDYTSSSAGSDRRVNVSSGVMAANLVSGPKPSYPMLASLTRTQGNVVMQAVISKSGTVEDLHVIKGHRLLRGAAKSAVQTWRYRPYKINGVPVEVATIVSVEFSLHR